MKSYDVAVIGGGTAGSAAARAAREAGAKTVMFNAGELGGLCILRGCMPTKTMLHSAHVIHHARHHGTRGIGHAGLEFDFAELMANKDAKVARFQAAKVASIESGGYEVVDAQARFTGPDTVEAGGEAYRFEKGAVIAVGSVAQIPTDIDGLDHTPYMTSDELMRLRQAPESVLIVGSRAIGLEFAQFFARLGSRVELVSRREVLGDVDPEIAAEMRSVLDAQENLHAHHRSRLRSVRPIGGEVEAVCVDLDGRETTLRAELLVLATGRRPAIDGLGLELAYVDVRDHRVLHSAEMRTTNPNVFVAGDASGERLLLHVANWEGRAAGLGAARVPGDHSIDHRLHMEVVFFDPALATVGRSAEEARDLHHDVVTASARFPETGRAITMDVAHGIWKLVVDRPTGEILGSQILGPRADDLIHVVAAAMHFHGTAQDLLRMPWYHPTLSEILLGLARDIERQRNG